MTDTMTTTAPERIWLQIDPSGDPNDRSEPCPDPADVELTWCWSQVGGQEVEYVRADLIGDTTGRESAPEAVAFVFPDDVAAEGYDWLQIAAGEVPVDDAPEVLRAIAKHMLAAAPTPDGGELPSDEELLAWAGEEEFFLFCDQEEFLDIAKSVLRRYAKRLRAGGDA